MKTINWHDTREQKEQVDKFFACFVDLIIDLKEMKDKQVDSILDKYNVSLYENDIEKKLRVFLDY